MRRPLPARLAAATAAGILAFGLTACAAGGEGGDEGEGNRIEQGTEEEEEEDE